MARTSSSSGLQLVSILAATLGFLFLPYLDSGTAFLTEKIRSDAQIAIEHNEPLALQFAVARNSSNSGVADFRHDGREVVKISLPASWILREARGGAIASVTREEEALGFIRWSLPPGITASFRMGDVPSSFIALSPSPSPLKIELTRVFLEENRTEKNVILMKDGTARLW